MPEVGDGRSVNSRDGHRAQTRHTYEFMVFIERSGATLGMRLPPGKYTAAGDEAMTAGSWILLEEVHTLSRMLQRELVEAPQGGDVRNRGIKGGGSNDRGLGGQGSGGE